MVPSIKKENFRLRQSTPIPPTSLFSFLSWVENREKQTNIFLSKKKRRFYRKKLTNISFIFVLGEKKEKSKQNIFSIEKKRKAKQKVLQTNKKKTCFEGDSSKGALPQQKKKPFFPSRLSKHFSQLSVILRPLKMVIFWGGDTG